MVVIRLSSLGVLLGGVLLASCDGGGISYEIENSRRFQQSGRLGPVDDAKRFGLAPKEDDVDSRAMPFSWDLPATWEELPKQEFRDANFKVAGRDDVQCYMSIVGGSLDDNVNRWRQQFGESAITSDEISSLPKKKFFGRDASLVEIEGPFKGRAGQKLLGMLLQAPRAMITMKMTGPATVVDEERSRFLALCESVRIAAEPPSPTTDFDRSRIKWSSPEGWQRKESGSEFRVVTFTMGADAQGECAVYVLSGGAGGVAANLNRWRKEIGQGPLGNAAVAALPRVNVLGVQAPWVHGLGTFEGMTGPKRKDWGMIGVVCPLGSVTLFVKMTGPGTLVVAEKARFFEFCRSLEMGGG